MTASRFKIRGTGENELFNFKFSKGAVTFSQAFWKTDELAGALYSSCGPFVQMYDQTGPSNQHAALVK